MITWQLGPDRALEWRDIRLAALCDAPESFDATLAEWQDRPLADFAARLAGIATFVSGDVPGQPLATAGWLAVRGPRATRRGWLLGVYARPQARGRGYAEAVIHATLADAKGRGMTSMGLNVRDTATRAQALYHRLGFRPTGRTGVRNARGEPEIEMLLDLAP